MTIADMHVLIHQAVTTRERLLMVSQNLHSVYLHARTEALRQLQDKANYIRIDGIPIVYFGRLLGFPISKSHRTGWMDWLDPFMQEAALKGWRIFYLGSKPGIADKGAHILKRRYPELQIATAHGYFNAEPQHQDNQDVLRQIRTFNTDVLVVGMGMPRQERWILQNYDAISAPVILTSGACMDYVAGEIKVPPRWLGPIGLEWLYRLVSEPRRLWRRYLIEPWYACWLLIHDLSDKYLKR
jgi:N-acetylglucosaminyldiphosphoundecaprenol N-acetyl-beta-D-mannosaminyltransferase